MIGGGPQKITVEIGGKIAASLGKALRESQRQVSTFGRNATRTMNDAAIAGKKGFKGIFDNALWQQASIGAAGIGLALAGSVRVAAEFETRLTAIGKITNASDARLKQLGGRLSGLSGRGQTNQSMGNLAAGIEDLVGQGLGLDAAEKSIGAMGKVATATNSDLLEVTKTGFQLQNALKIDEKALTTSFDRLAFLGKQGAFEMKDMSRFMPTIASSAAKMGIQGEKGLISIGAMMQMVRKDAPDSAQASTRLTDAMEKMMSPTVGKGFQKFGVNIESVMKGAMAKGINPMEAALDKLFEVTKGDPFKVSEIFGDKEARAAVTSMLKYRKEFAQLKADAASDKALGTIDADYQKSITTFASTLTSFQNSTQRLGVAVGNSLLPPLTALAGLITPLAEGIAGFAANNPAMTTVLVTIGGLAAGLVLVLPIIAGVVSAIGALTATFPVLAGIGTVIAVAGGPITLIIAGVVLLGIAIESLVRNWDSVKKATAGAWQGVVATWGKFTGWIGNVFNQALGVIRAWGSKVLSVMTLVPRLIISMFTGSNLGQRIMTSIIDGLKAKAGALFGWIRNTWSNITGFFGGGAAPAPANGAAPAAALPSPSRNAAGGGRRPPGRALGGPVTAGMPYIVGEKRRELFVPGMDGAIIPRIARPAAAPKIPPININAPVARQAPTPAPITINAPVTINATGDGAGIRDQVRAAFEDLMAMASSGYRVALND